MTNTVLIKRSGTLGAVPVPGDLTAGELAINYTDGNLFYKNSSNVVTVIASNQFLNVTGNITGGNLSVSGNVIAGTVNYTNIDGTADQVLATYGNGVTYFKTVSTTPVGGGFVRVYVRSGGYVNIDNYLGYMDIVGRTGNIAIQITP